MLGTKASSSGWRRGDKVNTAANTATATKRLEPTATGTSHQGNSLVAGGRGGVTTTVGGRSGGCDGSGGSVFVGAVNGTIEGFGRVAGETCWGLASSATARPDSTASSRLLHVGQAKLFGACPFGTSNGFPHAGHANRFICLTLLQSPTGVRLRHERMPLLRDSIVDRDTFFNRELGRSATVQPIKCFRAGWVTQLGGTCGAVCQTKKGEAQACWCPCRISQACAAHHSASDRSAKGTLGKRRPSGTDHEAQQAGIIGLDATITWRCREASYPR